MTEILKTATKRRRKVKVKFITVTNVFIGLCAILIYNFPSVLKKIITKLSAEEKSTDQIKYPIVITLPLFATIKSAMFFCIWNAILNKHVTFLMLYKFH